MGRQESYLTVNNQDHFDELVEVIRKLGDSWFDNRCVDPVRIITLKQDISVNLAYQCRPDITIEYKKGTRFVYFSGERHCQRSVELLLGDIQIKGVQLIFTECFPSDEIFAPNSTLATHAKFKF